MTHSPPPPPTSPLSQAFSQESVRLTSLKSVFSMGGPAKLCLLLSSNSLDPWERAGRKDGWTYPRPYGHPQVLGPLGGLPHPITPPPSGTGVFPLTSEEIQAQKGSMREGQGERSCDVSEAPTLEMCSSFFLTHSLKDVLVPSPMTRAQSLVTARIATPSCMSFMPGFYPKCFPCIVSLNSNSSPIGSHGGVGGYDAQAHTNGQWQRQDSNPRRLCSECLSTDMPSLPSSQRIGKACESRPPLAYALPPPPCAASSREVFTAAFARQQDEES